MLFPCLSSPYNVDYQYYVDERKEVPKDSGPLNGIIVKYTEAKKTVSSLIDGKRILVCGTTETKSLFFAVYNTAFNITEYVYEDPIADTSVDSESCKDIHVNEDTGHLVIVSTIVNAGLERTHLRGFSLESKLGHKDRNEY